VKIIFSSPLFLSSKLKETPYNNSMEIEHLLLIAALGGVIIAFKHIK